MDEESITAILEKLIDALHSGHSCNDCCDCTTVRSFEGSAVRFNEQAAFAAAESQKAFVQQNAAQFAQLLAQQKT